jgi:hypothetical protein
MQQLKVIHYVKVGNVSGVATPEASIEGQKKAILKYCKEHNLNPVRHFANIGSAGSFERPGFKEMLAFIGNNEQVICQILITNWDRFSRNPEKAIEMIHKLRALGIEVIAINQPPLAEFFFISGTLSIELECEYAHPCFKIHKDNMPAFAAIIGETELEHHLNSEGNDYILINVTHNRLNEAETNIIKRLTEIEEKQGTAHEIVDSFTHKPLNLK